MRRATTSRGRRPIRRCGSERCRKREAGDGEREARADQGIADYTAFEAAAADRDRLRHLAAEDIQHMAKARRGSCEQAYMGYMGKLYPMAKLAPCA